MAKPNKTLEWIPTDDVALIIQPPIGLQNAGFVGDQKPLSQHFNYTWNMISKWTGWLHSTKFDLDNALKTVALGVDFTDVSTSILNSSILGYQALPSRFDNVIVIGYQAVKATASLPAGSTVIGVGVINGVDYVNPTLIFGYDEFIALALDYTTKKANADFSFVFADGQGVDSALKLVDSLYLIADGSSQDLPVDLQTLLDNGGWRFYHSQGMGSNYTFTLEFYNATKFRIFGASIYSSTDGVTDFYHETSGKRVKSWYYDDVSDLAISYLGEKGYMSYNFLSSSFRLCHSDFLENADSGIWLDDSGNIELNVFGGSGLGTARIRASIGGELAWETWFGTNDKHTRFVKRLSMQAPFNDYLISYTHTDINAGGGIVYRPAIMIDVSSDPSIDVLITHIKKAIGQDFVIGDRLRLAFKKRSNQNLGIGYTSTYATAPSGFNIAEDALILAQGSDVNFPSGQQLDRIVIPLGMQYGIIELQMVDSNFLNAWDGSATKVFTTNIHRTVV